MSSSDKGKGKEAAPLPGPSSGSANPAASLSSLWAYLLPALNHIVKSSTNNNSKAPPIDMHVSSSHPSENKANAPSQRANGQVASGNDLYEQLDKYFLEAAREIMLGVPQDDTALVDYIVPSFQRYSVGAVSVNRLLNYVNRHYVKRAVDEDRGWLRLNDVIESVVAKSLTTEDSRDKISELLKEKRIEELTKWGYKVDGTGQPIAVAEASAEAASPPDRIVSVASLAHRRFRTEVFEPLLAVPVIKGTKPKKKKANGAPPRGRLARAVKDLVECKDGDKGERARLAKDLATALRLVGIRTDHPLRKRLDKFATSG
ncbi:hypothetical protein C8F01DRAFT_1207409 [Mycena amicta]|nr:hypothetical protein C8F01DRAFT_1207409 [Mycena amicta]